MLQGRMMDMPMMISSIIDYAAQVRSDSEIVSHRVEGDIHRYTYPEARRRSVQLAHALRELGIGQGDRVATMAWNGYRHLELYYAISGIGAVCHTINPRLFADQIVYVVNHAEDRILFLDATFVPLIEPLAGRLPDGMRYVIMCSRDAMPDSSLPNVLCYEDLIAGQPDDIVWPTFDERAASSLCYTSGTTGNPKGVLYSHRSTMLHTLGMLTLAGESGLSGESSSVLPVVPLFHANAWGLPYVVPLLGSKLVFPGMRLDGPAVFDLMDQERVTSAWGVPTVWLGVLAEMRKRGRKPDGFTYVLSGGSAVPRPMIEEFENTWDVRVIHGWGMTEMSPVGTTSILGPSQRALDRDEQIGLKALQGRPMYTVDIRIVDEDGQALPHDGEAFGELQVRGHAVIDGYHADEEASREAITDDGWLKTGDVAKIREDGFLVLVDRTKDVIKSGGEWISSIDLENAALGHPAIAECAVIAIPHPKWAERPLLIASLESGQSATADDVRTFLEDKVAKWWLPDDVIFVDDLPHTATGKLSKLTLRERFGDHKPAG